MPSVQNVAKGVADFVGGIQEGIAGPVARAQIEATEARSEVLQREDMRREAQFREQQQMRAADAAAAGVMLEGMRETITGGYQPFGSERVAEAQAKWGRIFADVEGLFPGMSPEARHLAMADIQMQADEEIRLETINDLEQRLGQATAPGAEGEPPAMDDETAQMILQTAQAGDIPGALRMWEEYREAQRQDKNFQRLMQSALTGAAAVEMKLYGAEGQGGIAEYLPFDVMNQMTMLFDRLENMQPGEGDPRDIVDDMNLTLSRFRRGQDMAKFPSPEDAAPLGAPRPQATQDIVRQMALAIHRGDSDKQADLEARYDFDALEARRMLMVELENPHISPVINPVTPERQEKSRKTTRRLKEREGKPVLSDAIDQP